MFLLLLFIDVCKGTGVKNNINRTYLLNSNFNFSLFPDTPVESPKHLEHILIERYGGILH